LVVVDMDKSIMVEWVGGNFVVWDFDCSRKLYANGFYGMPIKARKPKDLNFNSPLVLSPIEALYLLDKGVILVVDGGRVLSRDEVLSIAKSRYKLFNELYLVYCDLRNKGFVVRPGMKFGADFAVYKHGPGIDHAPFLVEVLPVNEKLDPIHIVRAGRLSHSVKKKFIIAMINPDDNSITYISLNWFKA